MVKIKLNAINDIKEFVDICSSFEEDVLVKRGSYTVDGSSILGILSIDTSKGVIAEILTEDDDVTERFASAVKKFTM